ncbi:PKD domain-containing protein [Geothrix sp. PMB-07]|uniref:PKD domain-containing protein n=1 Tax=Geothrix sp. PMB-07 TaxID=3068640 RepID=UPI0027410F2E|nr:PKD domain-containing protein [Geothrix sp. PMB-07]WLT30372.1 PKD domain-containing protein [Geothrix sp. PMB-07]
MASPLADRVRRVFHPLLAALLWVAGSTSLLAEGANDPAPFIQARGTVNGKKVLFDNTHGSTAGAADWVIDGAFSDFANALADKGYYVKELRKVTPITLSDLSGWDVVVMAECNIPFKASEQAALLQYVQNGGALFLIADHYNADRNKNRWDGSEVFNGYRRGAWTNPAKGMSAAEAASYPMQGVVSSDWLATNFGVRFRYNALGDLVANDIVAPSQAFNITTGVATVAMHAGATLAILDPTKAKGIVYLPTTTVKWASAVDQGVYNGGGRPEGPMVAIAKVGLGKAAFIGDSSPIEDATPKYLKEETGGAKTTYAGWQEQNDATLMPNLIDWLATRESYSALSQVAGLQLDTPTALLAMEDPASSTEPQAEPWAVPAAGYKWYDPTTFKAGSYNAGTVLPNVLTAVITTPSGNLSVNAGVAVSFAGSATDSSSTATITYAWTFGDGGTATGASATHTFSNATASPITYTVTFTASDASGASASATRLITVAPGGTTYTITASAGANGTISPSGAVSVSAGASRSFTMTPNAGYQVSSVTVDGVNQGALGTYTFSNVVANHSIAAAFATSGGTSFTETFDTGTKAAYTTGDVTFASGTWTLNDALLGNTSADPKIGAQSVRMRNSGKLTMKTSWANGAQSVSVKHGSYGSDASTTWTLWYSTNSGSTWTQVGGTITTASPTLQTATFSLSVPGAIRFEIRKTDGSTRRVNFDDFQVSGF